MKLPCVITVVRTGESSLTAIVPSAPESSATNTVHVNPVTHVAGQGGAEAEAILSAAANESVRRLETIDLTTATFPTEAATITQNVATSTLTYSGVSLVIENLKLTFSESGTYVANTNLTIGSGGTLDFSNGGTVNAPIVLNGGLWDIDGLLIMQNNLVVNLSSSMDISSTSVFAYSGAAVEINNLTLAFSGGGTYFGDSNLTVSSGGVLQFNQGGYLTAPIVLNQGTLEVYETLIMHSNLVLSLLHVEPCQQWYAGLLRRLCGYQQSHAGHHDGATTTSGNAVLFVASTATLGAGADLNFSSLIVNDGVTLTINDPDLATSLTITSGTSSNGLIILAGDENLQFNPALSSTSNITVTGSGSFTNGATVSGSCTSTQSGSLLNDTSAFGGDTCSASSAFTIASGHTITWDGSSGPIRTPLQVWQAVARCLLPAPPPSGLEAILPLVPCSSAPEPP